MLEKKANYREWLVDLKLRIKQSQIKAALKVNSELLMLYWEMGKEITEKQFDTLWGDKIIQQLSIDLREEFPNAAGFSISNLKYIRKFYLFYSQDTTIGHQAGDQFESIIFQIPWRHQVEIISKSKSVKEALFYVQQTIENGWSRAVLINMVSAKLHLSQGKAVSNFALRLPDVMSDLAQQTLKDPYNFDFLTIHKDYTERELESALTENITRFLIELGRGFAFVGRQKRLEVGGEEFFIDLLFYHLELRCYIVIELKTTDFKPDYLGQLGFYVTAINRQVKHRDDKPTIGLLICKTKNNIVAEYALEGSNIPIGISEYDLNKLMHGEFKSTLPSIEEIEEELNFRLGKMNTIKKHP